MTSDLRILITNDDGIDAPGIEKLIEVAREISDDVWVVAPAHNQSGAGHRFSLGHELRAERRDRQVFAVDGTPADCVVAGCTRLLGDRRPDVVLSGINHGQNLGDIIHCSGTLAGAREGALQGALGIGLSQAIDYAHGHEVSWDVSVAYAAQVVRSLIAEGDRAHTYFNVNFPHCAPGEVTGLRVVPHQRFSRSPFSYYESRTAPDRFFVAVLETPKPLDANRDFHVLLHEKAITVTPLALQMTDEDAARHLEGRIALRRPQEA